MQTSWGLKSKSSAAVLTGLYQAEQDIHVFLCLVNTEQLLRTCDALQVESGAEGQLMGLNYQDSCIWAEDPGFGVWGCSQIEYPSPNRGSDRGPVSA